MRRIAQSVILTFFQYPFLMTVKHDANFRNTPSQITYLC